MKKPILEVRGLQKSYGKKQTLKDIQFSVNPSEIVALLGPNGAGKSTTMKILLGLRKADQGTIHRPKKEEIGYSGQDLSFPSHLKTLEVLKLVKAHYPHSPSLEGLIERLELQNFLHSPVGGLSGGEKRRLSLACALVGRPRLLVLDEPTTGLDVEARIQLWKEIQNFAAEGGSVLLSTHDLNEVSHIAHRAVIVDKGQVLFDGAVEEITRSLSFKTVRLRSVKAPVSSWAEDLKSAQDQHRVLTKNAVALIQDLFSQNHMIEDLEVSSATLEEAFIHIRKKAHGTLP